MLILDFLAPGIDLRFNVVREFLEELSAFDEPPVHVLESTTNVEFNLWEGSITASVLEIVDQLDDLVTQPAEIFRRR